MKFFHRTTTRNAASILKRGFRDTTGNYTMVAPLTGVWVSDEILTEHEGAGGCTMLQIVIKISRKDLAFYEVKEDGKPFREWCIPAKMLNCGAISVFTKDQGRVSLRRFREVAEIPAIVSRKVAIAVEVKGIKWNSQFLQ